MHYVDIQRTSGRCESVRICPGYDDAWDAYRTAIDTASPTVASVTWYFNHANDQQHMGTRILRHLDKTEYNCVLCGASSDPCKHWMGYPLCNT